ncbi:posphoenolpyruvate synthetase regulatory kinase/phosphorylase PpsR [Psychrobacter sp. I-STPA10]|uniref:posphoenolpyruvate synthetase regulatory kinase/phosphorylase PpsR n=1 Tax=Psychrobacter sp. I-STPA10 TaxID=2585769 RepID=UPI001E346539|nr:pyruvate, water dikinase regulatory protein [Psychrobacter sp. I-STPA10]
MDTASSNNSSHPLNQSEEGRFVQAESKLRAPKPTFQNRQALQNNDDQPIRTAFFISDGTAITAETLGRSILSQFRQVPFETRVIPYVDDMVLAEEAVEQINLAYQKDGVLPLVFDTIVNAEIREKINSAQACNLDMYEGLIGRIAEEIGIEPDADSGHAHDDVDSETYKSRIDAVHFALDNDDGARTRHYDMADIILIGVSRSGKTPTSLYLALQFGIRAANYPLTEDDLYDNQLPKSLRQHRNKLFGLVIDTDRLVKIRNERRAGSRYSSYKQCEEEQRAIQAIYMTQGIPNLNVSEMSVEEIATRILQITGLKRRIG